MRSLLNVLSKNLMVYKTTPHNSLVYIMII